MEVNNLLHQISKARISIFKNWVVNPTMHNFPESLEFGEIHSSLDELENRLEELREQFSVENFKKKEDINE